MREFLEGSQAIAKVVSLCKPGVISAYPITPQTHIVEGLAQLIADGKLNSQFINVESEHSAASVVLGASACGVRVFTATSSQGLFLMAEVLFNIAGMRLPVVLTCANRAMSAPISIWNDHQDSISLRDSGLIQLYAENIQEAVDWHLLAYRLAESRNIMLPAMVCIDGYILTHGVEPVDMPEEGEIDRFLPEYQPPYKLDVDNPITLGCLADPEYYMETRFAIQETYKDILASMPQLFKEFGSIFGRSYNFVERYRLDDAEKAIVAMGSVCGTIKDVVDELRKKGKKVGLLKISVFRPFPYQEIYASLRSIPKVAVVDRALSLGSFAPLVSEIKALFFGKKKTPKIVSGFVAGLGGRDITKDSVKQIFRQLNQREVSGKFVDLKPELLQDKI